MENCIFCKIIRKEIPSDLVYEDDKNYAFLDIRPTNPGHTLVVPKQHFVNVFDIDPDTWGDSMKTAQKIARALEKAFGIEGVNINTNNGADAGQVVFHSHIHVIPRHKEDGYKLWGGKSYENGQAEVVASKLREAL